MRTISLLLIALAISISGFSQDKVYNEKAIYLLDRMASVIGDLHSCSFHISTTNDDTDQDYGITTHYGEHDVYFSGSKKMHLLSNNRRGREGFWYNGDTLQYYSFTRNYYGYYKSDTSSTLSMITEVNKNYGVHFPGSDFFYPTFTDDLIDNTNRIEFAGASKVDGQDCYKIVAISDDWNVQLWLTDNGMTLPVKMIFIKTDGKEGRYEETFSDWDLNPDIPLALFDFKIPVGAARVSILSKEDDNHIDSVNKK